MKALQLASCVFGVLLLSACANTWAGLTNKTPGPDGKPPPMLSSGYKGAKKAMKALSDWAHNTPSAIEKMAGPMPTAYARQNKTRLLKPSDPVKRSGGLSWDDAGQYRAAPLLLPSSRGGGMRIEYNDDVSIFPVDGDAEPYPVVNYEGMVMRNGGAVDGRLERQIFFGYGSSNIGAADQNGIQKLATKLGRADGDYSVNVVGHASKRVDHVSDPARKRMINFKIAQKRADAVSDELQDAGVEPERVTSVSRGDEEPNPNRRGRPQEEADRRVDVYMDDN